MIHRLAQALAARQPRERWLLFALLALALPLGFGFLVIAPLADRTRLTEARIAEANDLLVWLGEQAALYDPATLTRPAQPTPDAPPPGVADVERSLLAAGLSPRLSRLSSQGDGRIELGFDIVPFQAVMGWLNGVRAQGLSLVQLQIDATEDRGHIRLDAVLEPAR